MEITSKFYLLLYWIEENYFKDMLFKAEKYNLDIVVSDIILDYDNGQLKYKKDLDISETTILDGNNYLDLFFKGDICPAVWNKIYRLDLYRNNNILHPIGVSLGEDLGTTPLLGLKAKRIGKINKAYVHYIQNFESITNLKPIKKIYELIKVFNLIEEKIDITKFEKNDISNKKIAHLTSLVFDLKYNYNDIFYKEALEYYCRLFEDDIKLKRYTLKTKICFKILKISPTLNTLKFILKCYRIKSVISNYIVKEEK